MNHCLAEIGIHHPKLRTRAIGIGKKLAVLIDYPASPGCTSPYAPAWIAERCADARRREDCESALIGRCRPRKATRHHRL